MLGLLCSADTASPVISQWRERTGSWINPWSDPDKHLFCSYIHQCAVNMHSVLSNSYSVDFNYFIRNDQKEKKRVRSSNDHTEWEFEFFSNS